MTKQTVAVNHRGDVLFRTADLLVAVKEGPFTKEQLKKLETIRDEQ